MIVHAMSTETCLNLVVLFALRSVVAPRGAHVALFGRTLRQKDKTILVGEGGSGSSCIL